MITTAADRQSSPAASFPAGFGRRGAAAGATSVVVFTAVHHLTISNIWATLPIMLAAGALCGWSLAWSYKGLFRDYSLRTWLGYNAAHLMVFAALGLASVAVFDPVTTVAAVMARGGPVDDLIARALPMLGLFIGLATVAMGWIFAVAWQGYLRLLVTISLLMLFLGSNISVLGLVDFGGAPLGPVLTFFALTFLLAAVFAAAFAVLAPTHHRGALGLLSASAVEDSHHDSAGRM